MASATLSVIPTFPVSTTVGAYPRSAKMLGQQPSGSAEASATVTSAGLLQFGGLDSSTAYTAAAQVSGAWRYIDFTAGTAGDPLEPLNVMDYGARFDNSTDDTAAIQAALDAAVGQVPGTSADNDDSGRIVQLPPGRGKVRGTLEIPANVQLRGHGPSATYLLRDNATGTTTPVVTVERSGVQQVVSDLGIIVNDTSVDGLSIAGGGGASILSDMRVVVRDVVIVGGRDGLVSASVDGQGNETRLSRVTTMRTARHGFVIGTTDAFIEGCTAAQAGDGDVAGYQSDPIRGFWTTGTNSRIYGCKAYGVHGTAGGVGFEIAPRSELSCCEAQDCSGSGFVFPGGGDAGIASGILIDSCGSYALNIGGPYWQVDALVITRPGGLYTTPYAYRFEAGQVVGTRLRLRTRSVTNLCPANPANVPDGVVLDIDNRYGVQSVAYAATITPDPWAGQDLYVGTLTNNITLANPATGPSLDTPHQRGMRLGIQLVQDATGGRDITFGANYKLVGGGSTITGEAANAVRLISFRYDGTYWRETGRAVT